MILVAKVIKEIKLLLANNELEDAMSLTEELLVNANYIHIQERYSIVKANYSKVEDSHNFGLIDHEAYFTEKNKIIFALLNLLEEIERSDSEANIEMNLYKEKIAKSNIKELLDDLINKTRGTIFEKDALMISYRFNEVENFFLPIKYLDEELDDIKSQINIMNESMKEKKEYKSIGILELIRKMFTGYY